MEEFGSDFIVKLYKSKEKLFKSIYEFNVCLIRYIHHGWLTNFFPEVSAELWSRLIKHPGYESYFSSELLRRLGIDRKKDFYDFRSPKHRFVLLPTREVEDLMFFAGIARAHSVLAQVVNKATVLHIKNVIGKRGYLFAIKKAPFVISRAIPSVEIDNINEGNLENRLVKAGLECLKTLLIDIPITVKKRFHLKLPSYYLDELEASLVLDVHENSVVHFLRRVLLHEVNYKWATLLF